MKLKLAFGAAILVAIAFLINTGFLKSALTDGYQVSEIKRYLIPIESASNVIEKTLGNNDRRLSITEMRDILDHQRLAINSYWKASLDPELVDKSLSDYGLVDISIVLKSGSKLVTTAREASETETPVELVTQMLEISNGQTLAEKEFVEDTYHYYVPNLLYDNDGRWIVGLVFQFHKEALRATVAPRLDRHLAPTLIIVLFSMFGIWWFVVRMNVSKGPVKRKHFTFDFVLVTLLSLGCSLLVNVVIFERQILELSRDNARDTAIEISARLNDRLSNQKSATDTDSQQFGFSNSFRLFDNFEKILVINSQGKQMFGHLPERRQHSGFESVIQSIVIGHLPEERFEVSAKLIGVDLGEGRSWSTVLNISKEEIFRSSISLLVNGITILFITLLAMVECLLLYLHLIRGNRVYKNKPRYELGFVRPAMFLFLFAIDLSLSILPLQMKSFDAEMFGWSRDIILGLPISAEFLCVGIFILVAGVWVDKRGWHEPFFVGLFVVGVGTLCSWVSTDAMMFILSRALVGVGYGLALMSAQGMVIKFAGIKGRARGFASLFAGLYSGSICGAAAGAILAERFGYGEVFFVGALVMLVLIIFAWMFMRSAIEKPDSVPVSDIEVKAKPRQKIKFAPLLKFIGNPVFIALSLLSSLPASIAVAGFLHFFTPVYLDQIGARESTIGQVLILYGICLIYFGPMIGRLIDRSEQKKYYMLLGGVLGGMAFATFSADFGVASMVIAIFLLGLSSSFVLSSQSTMILELKESKELGEGTALGIFRSISRIGQVVGPMLFGWVVLSGNVTNVINYLGYIYIGAMFILALFVMIPARKIKHKRVANQ